MDKQTFKTINKMKCDNKLIELIKGMNETAKLLHQRAVDNGFYEEKKEFGTLLMLVVSELSEALEADRKDKHASIGSVTWYELEAPDNMQDEAFKVAFQDYVKDTVEDEIADAFIRLYDLVGYLGIDIEAHIEMKARYNAMRPKKHGKKY